jgi:acyl-coenzyme A synthetase/AMP-(fatty) acid ligase
VKHYTHPTRGEQIKAFIVLKEGETATDIKFQWEMRKK